MLASMCVSRLAPILALAAAACAAGGGEPPGGETAPVAARGEESTQPVGAASVVEGNRAFGLALYRRLAGEPGNVFVSPISIAGAFGPVAAGAQGETRAEIARALRFPAGGGAALHPQLGALLRGLEREQPGATLSIADALWVQRGFALKAPFLAVARNDYDATVEELDFAASDAAARRINQWSSMETRGRIPTLVSPAILAGPTRLVVTNAVYLLADWSDPFPLRATTSQPFHLEGGGVRPVPLMHRIGDYRLLGGDGFAAIDLPYRDERLSMTVFIPHAGRTLASFEAQLREPELTQWLERLDAAEPQLTDLFLPRLEIEEEYDLVPTLGALGISRAFGDGADFGGISDSGLRISDVVHKTFVRIDEKGTEAAAATAVVMQESSRPEFRVDRPFFFLIRDKASGAILFLGRIADPGASDVAARS